VAKELGYTLAKLNQEITYEELILWSTYFDLLNEQQEQRLKKAKRRR
jgi:hypothetical protein|tara:strand:- start:156 stop:296 length:141 start_codon:yes stop_codon:yes gene_type:complete